MLDEVKVRERKSAKHGKTYEYRFEMRFDVCDGDRVFIVSVFQNVLHHQEGLELLPWALATLVLEYPLLELLFHPIPSSSVSDSIAYQKQREKGLSLTTH